MYARVTTFHVEPRDRRRHVVNVTFRQSEDDRDAAEGEFEASAAQGHVGRYAVAMQEALGTV